VSQAAIKVPDQWQQSRPSYLFGYQEGYGKRQKRAPDFFKTELARRAYAAGYTAGQVARERKRKGRDEQKVIEGPLLRGK
jgi:hypothetical protein